MAEKPHVDPAVGAEVLDGVLVLYHPGQRKLRLLNSSALMVWSRCDGSRTLARIVDEIVTATGAPAETIAADVANFVCEMKDMGLLQTAGQRPPR